jgi:hypothetical protein
MKVANTPPIDNEELVSGPTLLRMSQVWDYALEKPVVFTVMFYGYVSIIGLIYNAAYFDSPWRIANTCHPFNDNPVHTSCGFYEDCSISRRSEQ